VDADAHFDAATGFARDGQRGLHGTMRGIFAGLRITEIGQQAATVRLYDMPRKLSNDLDTASLGGEQQIHCLIGIVFCSDA